MAVKFPREAFAAVLSGNQVALNWLASLDAALSATTTTGVPTDLTALEAEIVVIAAAAAAAQATADTAQIAADDAPLLVPTYNLNPAEVLAITDAVGDPFEFGVGVPTRTDRAIGYVFARTDVAEIYQYTAGVTVGAPSGVNIVGTDLKSSGGTSVVTLSDYTTDQVLRFSKPLAADSDGELDWDAYSPWPNDTGDVTGTLGDSPVPGQTWANWFQIWGNNGAGAVLLETIAADNGGNYYATAAAAFAAAAALLPVEVTGYIEYEVRGVNDNNPSDNRGGLSVQVEELIPGWVKISVLTSIRLNGVEIEGSARSLDVVDANGVLVPTSDGDGGVSLTLNTDADGTLSANSDAKVATQKAVKTYALTGSTGATDNRLLRSDGTGGKTAQASAITVDDNGGIQLPANLQLTGDISPSQITSNQNDYNPTGLSTASVLRLNSDASRNVTGLQGGADGRVLVLVNVGGFDLVLKDESASSTAANRFAMDADLTLPADTGASLLYDSTSSRWRLIAVGKASGGGGGGITALTGDVTASGSGSVAATIANDAVTYAKMQNVSAASRLLGRKTAGSGDTEELTLSEALDFVGSAAQGDILYRGASTWTRLGAGTAGQVLQANGAAANPSWVTPSGGSVGAGAMVLFASTTTTGSASSVTFSSITSGYRDIVIFANGRISNTDIVVRMRANGDTAANYDERYTNYAGTTNSTALAAQTSAAIGYFSNSGAVANASSSFTLRIPNYANTTFKKVGEGSGTLTLDSTAANHFNALFGWYWNSTSAISSLTIFPNGGNFVDGTTFSLYLQ